MANLKLIDPTPELATEFRAMAAEWREAGEDRFKEAFGDFAAYVAALENGRRATDLRPNTVPGSTFWLVADGNRVVGTSRLRYCLAPPLEKEGGHIGYDIRPSERRRGLGTTLLSLTLEKARALGLQEVLLTCDSDNVGSSRIIEKNGGLAIDSAISDRSGKQILRYRIVLNQEREPS